MSFAFIDIDINGAREEYQRAKDFVEKCSLKYSLSSQFLEELSGSEIARLPDLYAATYEWSSKGPMRTKLPKERVVIKLRAQESPLAVSNFLKLCTGELGVSKKSSKPLHYKNVPFHRIISGFVAQCGDIVFGNGTAGESTYGKPFKDDRDGLKLPIERGTVAMCNKGKNTNTSQFFFALDSKKCAKLCGKHVVLGEIVYGLDVVDRLVETCGVDADQEDGLSLKGVARIADCGVLEDFDEDSQNLKDAEAASSSQVKKGKVVKKKEKLKKSK